MYGRDPSLPPSSPLPPLVSGDSSAGATSMDGGTPQHMEQPTERSYFSVPVFATSSPSLRSSFSSASSPHTPLAPPGHPGSPSYAGLPNPTLPSPSGVSTPPGVRPGAFSVNHGVPLALGSSSSRSDRTYSMATRNTPGSFQPPVTKPLPVTPTQPPQPSSSPHPHPAQPFYPSIPIAQGRNAPGVFPGLSNAFGFSNSSAAPAGPVAASSSIALSSQDSCFCCDTTLRFPQGVPCFRCTVCETVNDITPRTSHSSSAEPLTISKLRLFVSAYRNSTCELPVLENLVQEVWGSYNLLNESFSTGTDVSLRSPGVELSQVREAYRLVSELPPTVMSSLMSATDSMLKRPGRRFSSPEHIKALVIVMENPSFALHRNTTETAYHHAMLTRLYGFVSCLANDIHRHLVDWFARDPIDLFRRRVETVNFYVTHRLTTKDNMREQYPTDWAIRSAAKVMALLFAANGLRRHEKLSVHEFYNTMVDYVDYFRDFQRWQEQSGMFAFCQYPFLISLGVKMQIMEMDAKRTMAEKIREAFWIQTFHGILTDPFLSIHVRRDHLIEDSLNQLQQVRPLELKKRLKIEFANEDGVDAGGLSKEWFLLLTRDLFDPQFGMWTYDDESHYCWFSQFSFDSAKEEYRLLGIVLGLAIFNNVIIPCPLPLACYKKLLNIPVDLDDLKVLRPSLGKGLQQLLDYTGNDVQDVFLRDFVVEVESFGEIQTVELIPNGRNRPVTSENKEEYVRLYVDWIFNRSVHTQFESFRAGFDTVCKGSPLTLFKPEELEMVVRGDEEIDIAALQSVTEYEGFDPREPTVRWFWEVAKSYSEEDKKKLLSFVTGSDRVSPTGIQTMQFKLTCLGNDSDRLPQSHTCFNQLGLYRYTSKEKLAWKLKTAIIDSSGFGLK